MTDTGLDRLPARLLPAVPRLDPSEHRAIADDFVRFGREGLPRDLEHVLMDHYRLDVSASYAGLPLRNPWGKGSGQLSMRSAQVHDAVAAGLGFVVLKTVIAEADDGSRSMGDWAVDEARMLVEPIAGGNDGERGWTVTWRGRGWPGSLADYLSLVREAVAIAVPAGLTVIPSVKYHLPGPEETRWRDSEYLWTTRAILDALGTAPAVIEKDFSPTLAGTDRSRTRATVLDWLDQVPRLIRAGNRTGQSVTAVVLKLFNALAPDDFQLEMLAAVHGAGAPDAITYANRLFDPARGVAYGGPDLSDRNLRVLSALRMAQDAGTIPRPSPEISATGNVASGRIAVEYLLRGCTSFQIHTLFQLPASEFPSVRGSKLDRALHRLYFDPDHGFIAWALHAARCRATSRGEVIRLLDLSRWGASRALTPADLDPP